ncbi:MAG TPA: anti-sigma factor, partial [Blastocatellia bacterium]
MTAPVKSLADEVWFISGEGRIQALKHELKTEELQERAAMYALGALSQHEARAFENHLREQCPVCEEEACSFADAVGQIGLAVEPQSPPDYLRDLLLSRIEKEFYQPSPAVPFPEHSASLPSPAQPVAPNRRIYLRLAIAASLVLMAATAVFFWRQSTRLQNELAQVKSTSSSSLRSIQLNGQAAAPQSSGNIYWDMQKNRWVVAVTLPPPPPGKIY